MKNKSEQNAQNTIVQNDSAEDLLISAQTLPSSKIAKINNIETKKHPNNQPDIQIIKKQLGLLEQIIRERTCSSIFPSTKKSIDQIIGDGKFFENIKTFLDQLEDILEDPKLSSQISLTIIKDLGYYLTPWSLPSESYITFLDHTHEAGLCPLTYNTYLTLGTPWTEVFFDNNKDLQNEVQKTQEQQPNISIDNKILGYNVKPIKEDEAKNVRGYFLGQKVNFTEAVKVNQHSSVTTWKASTKDLNEDERAALAIGIAKKIMLRFDVRLNPPIGEIKLAGRDELTQIYVKEALLVIAKNRGLKDENLLKLSINDKSEAHGYYGKAGDVKNFKTQNPKFYEHIESLAVETAEFYNREVKELQKFELLQSNLNKFIELTPEILENNPAAASVDNPRTLPTSLHPYQHNRHHHFSHSHGRGRQFDGKIAENPSNFFANNKAPSPLPVANVDQVPELQKNNSPALK